MEKILADLNLYIKIIHLNFPLKNKRQIICGTVNFLYLNKEKYDKIYYEHKIKLILSLHFIIRL